jgi:hypothetical protein
MILSTLTQSIQNRASAKALFFILCALHLSVSDMLKAEVKEPVQSVVKPNPAPSAKPLSFLIICKNLKLVRTLRVSKGQETYDTVYTKAGKDQIIAQTRMFSSGKDIAISVKDKLVDSGWSCREISDSQLTTSEPN